MASAKTSRILVTLHDDVLARLEAICREVGISKSAAISMALRDWLRENEARGDD